VLCEEGALDLFGVLVFGGIGSLGDIDVKVFFFFGKFVMHVLNN
jgi:hypothetical protein